MTPQNLRTRKRRMIAISATLVGLCLVIGCTAPTISVRRANLTKITTKGMQLGINLSVFNPNQYTMPLKTLSWNLDLFNAPFTKGGIRLNKQIQANRRTPVSFSIPAVFRRVTVGVRKVLAGQAIPWGFGGKANFQTPAGPVYVKFADTGTWKNPLKGMGIVENQHPTLPETLEQPVKLEIAIMPPMMPPK